jgi:hypothetical protein
VTKNNAGVRDRDVFVKEQYAFKARMTTNNLKKV